MKKVLFVLSAVVFYCACAFADKVSVDIYETSAECSGKKIGTVKAEDSDKGLVLKVNIKGIPEGEHGFHVHEHPSCAPAAGPDGKIVAALAAGGHYDPDNTGKHLGPYGEGHKGDLPVLTADKKGKIKQTVTAPRLTVADIKNRSIMIHAGGDNYSDDPLPLGGGGARIACGVVK
ncbi:MAG: superoxide dismutase [Cu-Zn] SodC [Endomicrobia bacterium]|nr:superoxide dismutase [Cu-Zn] SodC [Endomicrobiia bacterium]